MENINDFDDKPIPDNQHHIKIDRVEPKEEEKRTNLCISCSQNTRAVAFVPCAHYVVCLQCGHAETKCPVCQSPIMACVRIYE